MPDDFFEIPEVMKNQALSDLISDLMKRSLLRIGSGVHRVCTGWWGLSGVISMGMVLPLFGQQRSILDEGHVDLDWTFDGGNWSVLVEADEVFPPLSLEPSQVVFVAKDDPYPTDGSRGIRAEGDQWDFIGVAGGEPIWILPAAANEQPILELGFSTYGVGSGPGPVDIHLVDVTFRGVGEGHFSIYAIQSGQPPLVFMASADGIDESDFFSMGREDHRHLTWAFSAPGIYELSFAASKLTASGDASSRVTSEPQTIIVAVAVSDEILDLLASGVDPADLDGSLPPLVADVDLVNFVLNLPLGGPTGEVIKATFVEDDGEEYLSLDLPIHPDAQAIADFWVETSADLVTWQHGSGHTVVISESATRLHVRDAVPMRAAARRFIRLAVRRR